MIPIQEIGKQILSGNPTKFYIFTGAAYGIKVRYLEILKKHYGNYAEYDSFDDILKVVGKKSLFPEMDKLHICRYDESFIKSLGKDSADDISKILPKIHGTVVLIYENSKHCDKCSKCLPDYTTVFTPVSSQFIQKYLTCDFPNISSNLIAYTVNLCSDYAQASSICATLSSLSDTSSELINEATISSNFMYSPVISDSAIKQGVAARNFGYLISALDQYSLPYDSLFYSILSVLIEMDKLMSKSYPKSEFYNYRKCWNDYDIYYAFDLVYSELEASRNVIDYSIYDRLVYIFSVICTSPVMPKETLLWN